MKDTHIAFLSRVALILFLSGLILPPAIYVIGGNSPGSESMIVFIFGACLVLGIVLALISRSHLPARIVLVGAPIILCLLAALITFRFARINALKEEMQAKAPKHREEAHARHGNQRTD